MTPPKLLRIVADMLEDSTMPDQHRREAMVLALRACLLCADAFTAILRGDVTSATAEEALDLTKDITTFASKTHPEEFAAAMAFFEEDPNGNLPQ